MTRFLPLAVLLGPIAVLGAALLSQYVGGLNPCPMCIWQRWPHAIAIALAAITLMTGERRLYPLIALTLLVGAGIGVFHAGVEQGWWEGPSTCVGGDVGSMSTEDLINQIMTAPLVRCDEIVWSFLGLSMAAWNAIASVVIAAIAWAAFTRSA
ncbi:MAG: disulfide bond formation protein B [Pseudomonadota bacterium]